MGQSEAETYKYERLRDGNELFFLKSVLRVFLKKKRMYSTRVLKLHVFPFTQQAICHVRTLWGNVDLLSVQACPLMLRTAKRQLIH